VTVGMINAGMGGHVKTITRPQVQPFQLTDAQMAV